MTRFEFLANALQYGDKVNITLDSGQVLEGYFGGYRHYGNIIRDVFDIYPVFYAVKKDGTMSKKLLNNVRSWDPHVIERITPITPIKFTKELLQYFRHKQYNIDTAAHEAIIQLMTVYAKMHPGYPKIHLSFDDGVNGMLDGKYDSIPGTITAIGMKDGKLIYDISTQMDFDKDVPDYRDVCRCGIYIEDDKSLLSALLENIEQPLEFACETNEDFFNYITVGATLRLNGMEYYESHLLPGPVVTVLNIQEKENTKDDLITVRFEYGTEKTFPAKQLEPATRTQKENKS